jgi:hypothetical protein
MIINTIIAVSAITFLMCLWVGVASISGRLGKAGKAEFEELDVDFGCSNCTGKNECNAYRINSDDSEGSAECDEIRYPFGWPDKKL